MNRSNVALTLLSLTTLLLSGCGGSEQSSAGLSSSQDAALIKPLPVENTLQANDQAPESRSSEFQSTLVSSAKRFRKPSDDTTTSIEKQDKEEWAEWQTMAAGFVARKRKTPEVDSKQLFKRYAAQDEYNKKKKRDRNGKQAHWLETGEAGLYSLGVESLSEYTGYPEAWLRSNLENGKRLKVSAASGTAPWHYDATSDAILFVAEPFTTLFTDNNAYRLSQQRRGRYSMQKSSATATPVQPVSIGAYSDTVVIEQDNFAYPHLFNSKDANYWVWKLVRDIAPFEETLEIPSVAASGTATIRIYLTGASNIHPGDDHQVTALVSSGGAQVSQTVTWDGFEEMVIELQMDQSVVDSDSISLHLSSLASGAWQLLDRVEVDYAREMLADNEQLWMKQLGAGTHTVGGFSSDQIHLVESPLSSPVWRRDLLITPDGNGDYLVTFTLETDADVLVAARDAVNEPLVRADIPSELTSGKHKADYLIIAPRALTATAEALEDYRDTTHGSAKIVWLEDIYDEFSFGRVDPQAITDFLELVKSDWRRVPDYVALIGRGTSDQKNSKGYLDSWIPLQMAVTPWGLASSDKRYFDVDNDGINDFAGGRISVVTDDEGVAYVNKVQNYESLAFDKSWMRRVVLTADNPDSAGDFHADASAAADYAQQLGYNSEAYYNPTDNIRSVLTNSSTWESSVVGYMGHGLTTRLENFLKTSDVPLLNNSKGQALFLPLTCSAGNSNYPGYKSLSEMLVFPDQAELDASGRFLKGAIASLAPTGKSLNGDANLMATAFYDAVLAQHRPLGDALTEMQMQSQGQVNDFMLNIYWLLGDPALVLN